MMPQPQVSTSSTPVNHWSFLTEKVLLKVFRFWTRRAMTQHRRRSGTSFKSISNSGTSIIGININCSSTMLVTTGSIFSRARWTEVDVIRVEGEKSVLFVNYWSLSLSRGFSTFPFRIKWLPFINPIQSQTTKHLERAENEAPRFYQPIVPRSLKLVKVDQAAVSSKSVWSMWWLQPTNAPARKASQCWQRWQRWQI